MQRDISLEHNKIALARTPVASAFVYFGWDGTIPIADADVLILRDAVNVLCAARFIGYSSEPTADDDEVLALIAAYCIADQGETLAAILGGERQVWIPEQAGHDWGAMGLPEGPETPMRRLDGTDVPDDVDVAHRSAGYRQLRDSRALSIAPGDTIKAGGSTGTLVAIDRRKRTVEIEAGGGETRPFTFDDIEELEQGV